MNSVKNYYGKILKKSSDLKTNACCTFVQYPKFVTDALSKIHGDILSSYYGCGLIIPDCIKNSKIVDLGCGTGSNYRYLYPKLKKRQSWDMIDISFESIKEFKKKTNNKNNN